MHCPINLRLVHPLKFSFWVLYFSGLEFPCYVFFLEILLLSWHFPPCGNYDLWVLSSLSLPLSTWALFLISFVNCGVPSGKSELNVDPALCVSFISRATYATSVFCKLSFASLFLQTAVCLIDFPKVYACYR